MSTWITASFMKVLTCLTRPQSTPSPSYKPCPAEVQGKMMRLCSLFKAHATSRLIVHKASTYEPIPEHEAQTQVSDQAQKTCPIFTLYHAVRGVCLIQFESLHVFKLCHASAHKFLQILALSAQILSKG
eukprot:863343-Amphidinium_carterae.1